MSKTVIVVGTGNAAAAAALAARESGAKVIMLDKASKQERAGNTRFTFGLIRFAFDDPKEIKELLPEVSASEWKQITVEPYPKKVFYDAIMKTGDYQPDPDLTDWLVSSSKDTILWLTRHGMKWEFAQLMATAIGGNRVYSGGLVLQSKAMGEGWVSMQMNAVEQQQVEIRYSTAATALLTDASGAVTGVRVRDASGRVEELLGAVILAAGGFQANPEMRTRYLGAEWNVIKVRGARFDTGEMLQECLRIGAQTAGNWGGAHATCIDPSSPDVGELSRAEFTTRTSFSYGISVNRNGQRFFDEGWDWPSQTYVRMGKAVLKQPDQTAFQIFDQSAVELIDPQYKTQPSIVAQTLEELAEKCGINAAELARTVREYNAAIDTSKPFNPNVKDGRITRGLPVAKSNWANAIEKAPYVAYKVISGITFTFGGVKIDRHARVLDYTNQPVPGLYATGEMTGGFFYNSYPAGSGLMRGAVTGRAAGSHAAKLLNA
ncbi:FAD-dependent tricarballylate dehydrogenase TcuA [Bradyrhizobium sp. NP1]|uniref:FAD-dependent tricarballylate dehydrogenase TcuA n=1 Tax=Bradyrhizobium sp. NP1 TaxID=3049772 RepID=UPI0025A68822|nr:FAD-dependent tricarballylate dehydrogenase TcuA [Bradyrhizobium sp. NP1]WJR80288.1 FAD-dependent tricarballylate dehydrogenase TcuA [Bradyrhizobium sp. NP1]